MVQGVHVPHPTRVSRVVLLGALVLFGACGDEPAPQHPTSSHSKKKHKKHADSDVVVTDDSSDSDSAKAKRHHDTEVATSDDDDTKPKKKHHDDEAKKTDDEPKKSKKSKKSDEDEAKKTDDDEPKKSRKSRKSDDEESPKPKAKRTDDDESSKKSDDDEPPRPTKFKKSDDDESKKTDGDESKKTDDAEAKPAEPAPRPAPKKPAKHATKRKHAVAKKTPKAAPKDTPADEIEMDDEAPASGAEASTDTAAGTGDENEASASVAAPMPAPAPVASPLALNDRALVVGPGALEVHGGLRTGVLTLPGLMPGTSTSSTSEGLALGVAYGIAEKAEVGADYVLSLSPGSIKGPLTFHGAYLAYMHGKLDAAVAGALAVDFQDSTDPTTMMTTTKTSFGLELGGWVRYRATPKVSLFTGLPALPASTASLSKLSFALPPLPYQLAIGLNGGGTIALDLPAGVGIQAAPAIYVFAMTDLAHVKISNTANAFLFADFIPLTLGGFYSMPKLDLGATFADDLKQGFGYLSFELLARYAL